MGWSSKLKSDIGIYRSLENGNLKNNNIIYYASGGNENRTEIWSYNHAITDQGEPFMAFDARISTIAADVPMILAGWNLLEDGEPTSKYLCVRWIKWSTTTASSLIGIMQIGIFDDSNNSWTTINDGSINIRQGPSGSIHTVQMHASFNMFEHAPQGTSAKHTQIIFNFVSDAFYPDARVRYISGFGFAVGYGAFERYTIGDIMGPLESEEFGPASLPDGGYNEGAGHGSFDNSSDIITHSGKPLIGVTTAGFINVYKITQGQLNDLGAKLFPSLNQIVFGNADPTTEDILMLLAQIAVGGTLTGGALPVQQMGIGLIDVLINGKLIDYILDCHVIPCSISGATVEGLKVGYRQFNDIQVARATEDYAEVDCGSLSIPEYWGNFLDFANVRCKLYLPFYGFIDLEPEAWNGGTISVKYIVNIVDGSFQALVYSTSGKSNLSNSLIGQYGGTCCVHYPITGLQYSNVISGLITAATGAAVSAASGDMGGAVSNAGNIANLRPMLQKSNSYNASNSFLSHRKPYLLIERGVSQFSVGYQNEKGLPLNVYMNLANVHGFTVIEDPVINIDCTEAEHDEIVRLMKEGIIL